MVQRGGEEEGRVREMCGGWREGKKKVCREEGRKGGRRKGGRGRYGGGRKGEVWRREEGGGMEEERKGEVWRREEGGGMEEGGRERKNE